MALVTVTVNLAVVAVWGYLQLGDDRRRMAVGDGMRRFCCDARIGQTHLKGLENEHSDEQIAQHGYR